MRRFTLRLAAVFAVMVVFFIASPEALRAQAPQVVYSVTSEWGTGFQTSVTITNPGTAAINGWTLKFTLPYSISSIWNATIDSHAGNVYTIAGDSWDLSIPAGGSVNFGFVAGAYTGSAPANPTGCTVNGEAVSSTTCTTSGGGGTTTPPGAPSGLAASSVTSTSLKLTWTAGAKGTNPIASYDIFENGILLTTSTTTSAAISGLAASTTYSFTVAAVDSTGVAGAQSAALSVTTSAASGSGGGGSSATTGTIGFHLLLGDGSTEDTLSLAGNNYTDLIQSNIIAGVMEGHLVGEYYPGIQFDKDYLYGSILGQLLQENIETELYESSSSLIDPSPDQQAVMGEGQGGPYQINNYAVDLVSGTYTPEGHSLINYIALQQNIGYTFSEAATQYEKVTPPSFNNKYFGPMLTAYFHYNDFVSLAVIGTGTNPYTPQWQPYYDEALANFKTLPNNFLDILLNVAYNQGYYGTLVTSYSEEGATATASTVETVDSYASVWGSSDTYEQYPYQVRYYLDQFYDNPIPTTSPTVTTTPANHVVFTASSLGTVFSDVFQMLSYKNSSGGLSVIIAAQAQSAFTTALGQTGVSSSASLDLSNAASRASIFTILEDAIGNLEKTLGVSFNATSTAAL
jgi:hypothetical protein